MTTHVLCFESIPANICFPHREVNNGQQSELPRENFPYSELFYLHYYKFVTQVKSSHILFKGRTSKVSNRIYRDCYVKST